MIVNKNPMGQTIEKTEHTIESHLQVESMQGILPCLKYLFAFLSFDISVCKRVKYKCVQKTNNHKK